MLAKVVVGVVVAGMVAKSLWLVFGARPPASPDPEPEESDDAYGI